MTSARSNATPPPGPRGEGGFALRASAAGSRRDLLRIGPPDDLQFALAIHLGRTWLVRRSGQDSKAVFAAGGFGARAGFGKRPALLVIDVNWAFFGERPEPILESIKRWRTSCGEASWAALEYIKSLIEAARGKGIPVIYTTGERRPDN